MYVVRLEGNMTWSRMSAALLGVITVLVLVPAPAAFQPADAADADGRGCCSWHKGVCGCENGRTACCDGTLSPSCTC